MTKLKSRLATPVAMLAVACALAGIYTQPAMAQTAKKLKCNGCVKSKQLKNGAITGTDIRNNTIGGAKIQSNAVTTDKIQSNAVTAAKIANGSVDLGKLSPAVQAQLNASGAGDITGVAAGEGLTGGGATGAVTLDVNFAGSGTANTAARSNHTHDGTTIDDESITADDLAPASVGVSELADNAVTSGKIADGAVGTADLATNAVTSAKIANGAVDTGDLATDAVTSAKIADGAVGTGDLAANAVTSDKIADGALGTGDLAANAVTSDKIADGAVGAGDLATNAVTSAKIVDGAVSLGKLSPAVQAQLNAAGNGDITGVTAGSGLNGGGDTGDVTLNLDDNIVLGTAIDDGDLSIQDTTGTATVILDGDTGTVTNSLAGDGVVKAWARINADGTVASCYRCNVDPLETQLLAAGLYEVDFTPLSTDIRGRPRSVTGDGQIGGLFGRASIADRVEVIGPPPPLGGALDASSVFVATRDLDNSVPVNRVFTIVIY